MSRLRALLAIAGVAVAIGLAGCSADSGSTPPSAEVISAEGHRFVRWTEPTATTPGRADEIEGTLTRRGDGCIVVTPTGGGDSRVAVLPAGGEPVAGGVRVAEGVDIAFDTPLTLAGGIITGTLTGVAPCAGSSYFALATEQPAPEPAEGEDPAPEDG
jgi:hypothetical protein